MPTPPATIAPTHRAIQTYYQTLRDLRDTHHVTHEMGLRPAFQALLMTLAHDYKWTPIAEQTLPNRKRPDATLCDDFNIPRGYWEAKDTNDDLDTEIAKKIAAGYPTSNSIFEDTRRAVLYQGGQVVLDVDLAQPTQLALVLTQFFTYAAPAVVSFANAVRQFQASVPDLAQKLTEIVRGQRAGGNNAFQAAWASFYQLCQTSLDPNIRSETVDEMLVQHLLTERLFRTVFANPDFTRRNVIAAEIEQVVDALTSHAFNRREFLAPLDGFYSAIEAAAQGLSDWSEKQGFLDTVYERFFQGYSVKEADTRGIKYTPQAIVDFMCASVEEVLKREFGRSLSEPGVQILDPCTGTGNFIVNLIRRMSGVHLEHKYEKDLFANEVMLLPYYIAALNIEHAYFERTHDYRPFAGLCFADTLDLAEGRQMALWAERNTERVEREKAAEIMVVIGNPPYNVGQENENDNNKNRKYPVIDGRIRETYVKDSNATLRTQLYDAYVRFFRWATDRLGDRDGIICFVSNNSFADQFAFDGMRQHLLQDFTHIYHLDLHGNVRKNPKISGTSHNVFGIQVGVGITVAIRHKEHAERRLYYHRVPEDWRREQKLEYLTSKISIDGIDWRQLAPDEKHLWLTEGMRPEFSIFFAMGEQDAKAGIGQTVKKPIFERYSGGVKTNRDSWAYDFSRDALIGKMQRTIEAYNSDVDRWKRRGTDATSVDDFVTSDDAKIKWSGDLKGHLVHGRYATYSEQKIRTSLYRPFVKQYLYFDTILNNSRYLQHLFFPTPASEEENTVIVVSDVGYRSPFSTLVANAIPDLHLLAASDAFQCFPYYTYAEDGTNRRENITDWALAQFQAAYGPTVTKRDIFAYVYALLHHPHYRERYAENLKRELPRIPLVAGRPAFDACVRVGAELSRLHLTYEQAPEYPLTWHETPGAATDWRVAKMRLTPDKTALVYNSWLTLANIPPEAYAYRLGNRSALEWVVDQYQVSTDPRSHITSDPNRPDDPQYIARLIARVTHISVETVRLVGELAAEVVLPVPAEIPAEAPVGG